jgi:hypothetical protein
MQTVPIRSVIIKDYLLMTDQSINAESHDTMKIKTHQFENFVSIYRGADKSLARPGRKQAMVTEDFDVHISYL